MKKKMKFEYILGISTVVIVVLMFSMIIRNGISHKEHLKSFKEKCESNGGMMVVPKGVKGWPEPSCVNPKYYINMDEK